MSFFLSKKKDLSTCNEIWDIQLLPCHSLTMIIAYLTVLQDFKLPYTLFFLNHESLLLFPILITSITFQFQQEISNCHMTQGSMLVTVVILLVKMEVTSQSINVTWIRIKPRYSRDYALTNSMPY